jgi:hypothetical protein
LAPKLAWICIARAGRLIANTAAAAKAARPACGRRQRRFAAPHLET